ncbi:uncharacterized protein [Pyrus communis]|uniref:uncharacterized protein n=1 Tax=Pyrus communis TaxID=23211 RepID=UPI0035C0B253
MEDNLSPSMDIPEGSNENNIESILANLPGNPGLRLRISEYDPNIRDHIRRAYLQRELFLVDHNEGVKDVVFRNAPENLKLTSHDIQKDLVYAVACETTNAIMFDIGDDAFFSVLVEELHDILVKEQMAVVLRYVNTNGQVVERFVGIKHVPNTTDFSLKEAIDQFFSINGLSISRLRGQGYDRSSNMQASCKRRDMVRERQQAKVMEAIQNYELLSGQGLNQETSLKHASDTHWGSHYGTLVSLINMFSSVIEVLEMIADDGVSLDQRVKACKQQLQAMRDNGWDAWLDKVSSFCGKHDIDIPYMNDIFVARGRSRRKAENLTNLHHYRVDLFIDVIDKQLQELNSCFNETNFSDMELTLLEDELKSYIFDMRLHNEFSVLKGINSLAQKLVETKKDRQYPLVYLLVKLVLILPVATASIERAFSMMKIVKNPHRNRMGDQWLNDSLVVYIKKEVYDSINNDVVIRRFQISEHVVDNYK